MDQQVLIKPGMNINYFDTVMMKVRGGCRREKAAIVFTSFS